MDSKTERIARRDIASFFENISHHHLCELFEIIDLVQDYVEFETESEEMSFHMFAGLLWKATDGLHLLLDGNCGPESEIQNDEDR